MNQVELIVTALGAILLFSGIIGGGFEAKEIKVPRMGRVARTLAFVVGGMLILSGIGMWAYKLEPRADLVEPNPAPGPPLSDPAPSNSRVTPVPGPPTPSPVAASSFPVTFLCSSDDLDGNPAILTIFLDGQRAAELAVVDALEDATATLALRTGPHAYGLFVTDPVSMRLVPIGGGTVTVRAEQAFRVRAQFQEGELMLALVEDS